jgi:hypothetical protein
MTTYAPVDKREARFLLADHVRTAFLASGFGRSSYHGATSDACVTSQIGDHVLNQVCMQF